MTSQRYLNDKADSNDLKRSFFKVIPYAVIALVVLCLQHLIEVVQLVTSQDFKMSKNTTEIISFFGNGGFLYPDLILYGMVLCGIIMSVMLFRFMLSKKSVNVYFSMGITRTRLYINRILAGTLALMLAVIVPMGIVLLINIANFGASQHLRDVFLYETCVLFVSGMAGFSIATVASTFSGSLVEMILNTFAISAIPSFISTINIHINEYLLKGYVGAYSGIDYLVKLLKGNAFSPWKFAVDLDVVNVTSAQTANTVYLSSPYSSMAQQVYKTVEENTVLDGGLMIPILIWVIISAVLLALGYVLINKRKAENSNSFGKFYISAAVLGSTAFLGAAMLLLMILGEMGNNQYIGSGDTHNPFFRNLGLCLFVAIIALLIVFFVVELIVRRKLKEVVRMWPVFAALTVVMLGIVTFFTTEKFGTYNKLPAQTDISQVAIDIYDQRQLFNTHLLTGNPYLSRDPEDIKLAEDQFKKLSTSKVVDDRTSNPVVFTFKLKDGSEMKRRFIVYDSDLLEQYVRAVYASNYYKSNMKYLMLDEMTSEQKKLIEGDEESAYYDDGFGGRIYIGDGEQSFAGKLREESWYYASGDYIADNFINIIDGDGYGEMTNAMPFDDNEALMKALYNDLTKMSFDDVYMNSKRPVAVLFADGQAASYTDDKYITTTDYGYYYLQPYSDYLRYEKNDSSAIRKVSAGIPSSYKYIYIYDNMTETLELLKAHGYDVSTHEAKVKEVYYTDTKLWYNDALSQLQFELSKTNKDYYYWGSPTTKGSIVDEYFGNIDTEVGYSDYFGYIFKDEGNGKTVTRTELLNLVYDKAGHSLKKAPAEKAQAIVDKSVPFYCNYKDDGRYAYIVYEDNVIVCEYIPAANISVLG